VGLATRSWWYKHYIWYRGNPSIRIWELVCSFDLFNLLWFRNMDFKFLLIMGLAIRASGIIIEKCNTGSAGPWKCAVAVM
jgi:hypothetical protein